MIHDIFAIDRTQIRWSRAASSLVALSVAAVLGALAGETWSTVAIAALLVLASSGDGPFARRWPGMVWFTGLGAIAGGLAYVSADSAYAAAAVFGLATFAGTLAAAFGPVAARSGLLLTIWVFLALGHDVAEGQQWHPVAAFLIGGGLAIAVTWFRLRKLADDAEPADHLDEGDGVDLEGLTFWGRVGALVRSRLGGFAILRTAAVVLAVLLGYWWFDGHSLWAALTVILVVKPSTGQTASIAVQRTLGTAVGAVLALAVAQVLPRDDTAVMIAFLASAYLMLLFLNANYSLFATFLTATLVFAERLGNADAFEAGTERLLATLLGSAIGIAVMSLTIFVRSRDEPTEAIS